MIAKTLTQAVIAASIGAVLSHTAGREVSLIDLTVPKDRLPAGCALAVAPSERLDENRVQIGLWAGLNIPTNPWIGTEPALLAAIRERLAPPEVPDGPPLMPREARRYSLQLADGIAQAYVAIYRDQDIPDLTTVYALEFPTTDRAAAFARSARGASKAVISGTIAAFTAGPRSDCFEAVHEYLNGLSRK